jgi:hypothetical protein
VPKRCIAERPEAEKIPYRSLSGSPIEVRQSRAVSSGGKLALTPDSTAVRALISRPD